MANLINGTSTGSGGLITTGDSSDELQLQTAETTAVTINSSQNVGIGTTSPGARIEATASGAAVQILNRTTSDGNILELEKDGTTVGSIGANSGNPYFVKATGGIQVQNTRLLPADSSGAGSDGVSDLGRDISRWKDLYLSGSVYLGGTAAANALDDYEEGTWTPVIADASTGGNLATLSSATGSYTKIGNTVHLQCRVLMSSKASMTAANNLFLRGFPFALANTNTNRAVGTTMFDEATFTGYVVCISLQNQDYAEYQITTSGSTSSSLKVSDITNNFFNITTMIYRTA